MERSRLYVGVVALHGGGEYGDDGLKQTDGGIARAIRQHHERFPAIVVFPQRKADGTPGWEGAGGRAAMAPIRIFHGDADQVVPVDESWKMAAALKTLGADVQYTEFSGVDHDAWDPAYAREDLWVWLLRQRRR